MMGDRDKAMLNMYLNEKMTIKEIANETGFSERFIQKLLRHEGINLSQRSSIDRAKNKMKKNDDKVEDKPYIKLARNKVLYKDRIYEIISYKKLRKMLKKDLGIG